LAEENLRVALKAAPHDAGVNGDLARLLVQSGRSAEALESLETEVRASPQDPALREMLVRAYLVKGDLAAARTAAADLQTLRPDLAVGPLLAGLVAQQDKRPEAAEKDFRCALELQPDASEALAALVRLQINRGRTDEALKMVEDAVARQPKSAIAHNLLGEVYVTSKNAPAAIDSFRQAIALTPKWWLPYRNLSMVQ